MFSLNFELLLTFVLVECVGPFAVVVLSLFKICLAIEELGGGITVHIYIMLQEMAIDNVRRLS